MDTLQRLFGFSRPYDGHSPPSGRKSLSASLPNDTAQPVVPSPARNSVQKSSEKAESRTSLSGVRSEGDVSRNRSTIDKTQSTAKQSASRALRGNSVADASLECPPSAPSTSLGHSTPTARTERSPPVPPKDSPKAYGLGPPSSGIPYDARAHGPESGSRATFKPPATPSPLRHEDALNANNSAALASATALRDSASPHGSDAVSSQIAHRSRPSPPRNDSLESRKVSSKMRQSPGVASPSHRGGTSDVTTNGAQAPTFASTNNDRLHRPGLASRQTTQSSMALTSTLVDDSRSREPDTATRQSTHHPGVHTQGQATETPPAPERQNYERTCDDSSKICMTDDEPPSEQVDSGCDGHSTTTPKPATDQQSSNETSDHELLDTPNDELQEVELDDLTTEDFIIVIMGPTGAGKSSFVAKATNSGDEGVGHGLISHTSDIKATRCIIGGSNVVLVDTPGFDDTKKSDLQILESISDWFNKSYKKGTSPSGILYFHRISDNRMAGTPLKNLRVFKKLCGNKVMPHVVLVTTMWDEVDESVGDERFQELKDNYWRPMILQGSTTYRYRNTLKSAEELLLQLVERKRREIASQKQSADKVRLQKQMADKNMELRETDAGRELYSRLDQIAEKRAEILARITAQRHQAGDQATADDLAKQYESLKAELDETLRQMQALKLTSAQRVAARIRKTFK